MFEVPVALGVNVTEQDPAVRLHVVDENAPAAPVLLKVTVPVGTVAPAPLVSATVAVHDVRLPTTIVVG